MRCQACGLEGAEYELIEIDDGHVQAMRFCGNCLPDRVRMAKPARVEFTAAETQGEDLHLWMTVPHETAQSNIELRLSEGIIISFPAEDGQVFRFADKAGAFRHGCKGDLFVHINISIPDFEL